jgi:hypothetical protein
MRTLRYGADATWTFEGFDLPLSESVETATLTITNAWADLDEEQPPEPELLQVEITTTATDDGQITEAQDGDGNWRLFFTLSHDETQTDLEPPPRYLWYEVTLETTPGTLILRPFVGQVRMLPDLFIPS